ncbi:hypothetical protein [Echinicola salinicaeni]|uniref:hypothetical protein n=1 Tax=Echinicola salinicaeni TaxID=2762757 RepID=UPI0016470BCB|nr:hypothetical protein [Echinicola salinicaeni]
MDSFKLSIFDIFGAIIPGLPLVILLATFIQAEPFSISALSGQLQHLNVYSALLLILISYLIGFSQQYLSYEIFKVLIQLWGKKRTKGHPISFGKRGKEISLIREKAIENSKVLNVFFALRTMCYNAFLSLFLISVLLFLYQSIFFTHTKETLFIGFLSFILYILFLRRAVSYHEWGQELITNSIKTIKKLKKNN